jgi:osmoprotectant transport system substrate-binding protein
VAVVAAAALALAACGSSKPSSGSNPLKATSSAAKGSIVVGSANFPESTLVGTIYAQALEAKGVKVTTKFDIGAREIYYPQVQAGTIAIMPEYNGALLTDVVDKTSTAATESDVDAALNAKLPASLQILNPSVAQDKDSVTVTAATASKYHLKSISDLAPDAKNFVLGGPPEFQTRVQGVVGLKDKYGLTFKSFQPLDEAGPLSVAALKSGRVQAADIFSTDPSLVSDHFVSLQDPKNLFTAQNVVPLVYKADMTPTITGALNDVQSKLTQSSLVAMDAAVANQHESYATVATQFLAGKFS